MWLFLKFQEQPLFFTFVSKVFNMDLMFFISLNKLKAP